jgi:hypothetical protein
LGPSPPIRARDERILSDSELQVWKDEESEKRTDEEPDVWELSADVRSGSNEEVDAFSIDQTGDNDDSD